MLVILIKCDMKETHGCMFTPAIGKWLQLYSERLPHLYWIYLNWHIRKSNLGHVRLRLGHVIDEVIW